MLDSSTSTEPDIVLAARVLGAVNAAVAAAGLDYLVIGATARNILCISLFGRLPGRATRDVDIAVAVPTWQAYQRLTENLTRRAGVHAFTVEVSGVPVPVDIVPYGGVEDADRTVHLPNEHTLNVLGLREAFASSQAARLPDDVLVRVPTVPGLALLKLVAWSDRHLLHRRDAVDLDEIMTWYTQGPLLDDLYDDVDLLSRYDFDVDLAAAHRLGTGIGELLGPPARAAILTVVDDEHRAARLHADMGPRGTRDSSRPDALTVGIREASEPR